jgi:hypothetical protein
MGNSTIRTFVSDKLEIPARMLQEISEGIIQ